MHEQPPSGPLAGLELVELGRSAIRTRESQLTLAGWRLVVASARGAGTIERVDLAGGTVYRGSGIFLGWSQRDLTAAYQGLLPPAPDPLPDPGQFG